VSAISLCVFSDSLCLSSPKPQKAQSRPALRSVLLTYIFGLLGDYQIVVARSVQGMFWQYDVCRPIAGLIGSAVMLPCCQLRTLHKVSYLSVVSFLTIVAVVAVCTHDLIAEGRDETAHRELVNGRSEFCKIDVALSRDLFA